MQNLRQEMVRLKIELILVSLFDVLKPCAIVHFAPEAAGHNDQRFDNR
ncbi:Uncharacterised protein [Vibrio cholerae]|nr:Uncharacterised protein [Vibrio cholerae]CSC80736.1 Uncharacterised protein [Vibrio cholerae]CSD01657.1 Uncharacterised protein [Vibrio cholerae]CSH91301.1 Uncharacterised protein [Vibrio cholerae]